MTRIQLFNGRFVPEDQAVITSSNRGYRYGDGFFESMRVAKGRPLFAAVHWDRVLRTAAFLRITVSEDLDLRYFEQFSKELCQRNGFRNARIRFQGFRSGSGKYTPDDNRLGWSMVCSELPSAEYQLNRKGLSVGICTAHRINPQPQSSFKTGNSLPYVLGGIHAQQKKWDDCLLLDPDGFIAESTNSNLFLVKEDTLLTPDLSNGGVNGVMRSVIIDLAASVGFNVKMGLVSKEDLLESDECFLTNAVRGIQWVGAFDSKRYFRKKTEFLLLRLNQLA